MALKTRPGFTRTCEGCIPHYRHVSGVVMPVKVRFEGGPLPRPVRENGRLVYIQPNREDFIPESEEEMARLMRGGT